MTLFQATGGFWFVPGICHSRTKLKGQWLPLTSFSHEGAGAVGIRSTRGLKRLRPLKLIVTSNCISVAKGSHMAKCQVNGRGKYIYFIGDTVAKSDSAENN